MPSEDEGRISYPRKQDSSPPKTGFVSPRCDLRAQFRVSIDRPFVVLSGIARKAVLFEKGIESGARQAGYAASLFYAALGLEYQVLQVLTLRRLSVVGQREQGARRGSPWERIPSSRPSARPLPVYREADVWGKGWDCYRRP